MQPAVHRGLLRGHCDEARGRRLSDATAVAACRNARVGETSLEVLIRPNNGSPVSLKNAIRQATPGVAWRAYTATSRHETRRRAAHLSGLGARETHATRVGAQSHYEKNL